MFLPVLLLRDFGLLGYACFLLPNVIGAAAMGWVIRGPGASRRIVRDHVRACRAFSVITVAFQVYFAIWLSRAAGTAGGALWPVAAGAAVITYVLLLRTGALRGGVLIWAMSATVFAVLLASGTPHPPTAISGSLPARDVLFLAPVCIFGFGLCPYLDLTFHGAAVGAGPRRVAAFTIGFGALFASMVVLTWLYAGLFDTGAALAMVGPPAAAALLVLHIFAQLTYTVGLHHSYLSETSPRPGPGAPYLLAVLIAAALGLAAPRLPPVTGMSFGEVTYRAFMAFYGLVFPAYVWICVIPRRGAPSGPTRRTLRVWGFAVGMAAPMFWMGFIERQAFWLGPGMLIVLASRLLVRRTSLPPSGAPG
jgi:hypothetical protein